MLAPSAASAASASSFGPCAAMVTGEYRFSLELFRAGGERLGQVAVDVDWEPAREWARVSAARNGDLFVYGTGVATSVQPVWHDRMGAPYARGFRVRFLSADGSESTCDFDVDYFQDPAREASLQLVADGRLSVGETFLYVATAYPKLPGKKPPTRR